MIKRVVNIIVSFAVIFTAFFPLNVLAESDQDYTDYPYTNNVNIEPWQQVIITTLFKYGASFPSADVITDYNLTSTGSLNLDVELISATDEDGSTITFSSSTEVHEKLAKGYQNGVLNSYITVPKLVFKTVDTTNNYSTVQNIMTCNIVSGTSNYKCTYTPYETSTLESVNLNMQHVNFELTERNITGTDSTTGTALFNLNINTTGTITGTLNIETTGKSVYLNQTSYNAPVIDISKTSFSNAYAGSKNVVLIPNTEYVFVWSNNKGNMSSYINQCKTFDSTGTAHAWEEIENTSLVVAKFTSGNVTSHSLYFSNNFKVGNKLMYIYYFGPIDSMPDDLYRYVFGRSQLENLTEIGNTESQTVETNTDSTNTQLIGTSGQYTNIENQFNDNFTNAINDLNITDTLTNNQKFASSANWVRVQFNRIVNNTPFASVITFCLIIGFALIMIGKVRR